MLTGRQLPLLQGTVADKVQIRFESLALSVNAILK